MKIDQSIRQKITLIGFNKTNIDFFVQIEKLPYHWQIFKTCHIWRKTYLRNNLSNEALLLLKDK